MSGGISQLALAAVVFAGGHFLLSSAWLRPRLAGALGESIFLGLYSVYAVAALVWLILAYVAAPVLPLWQVPTWAAVVPIGVMPLALLLLVGGTTQPNPTAVLPGRPYPAERPAPGILAVTRHPVMWAIGLWALAHIPPNGDAASLILFGTLAALALGGTLAIDAKKRRVQGADWAAFAAATSNLPFLALAQGRARLVPGEIGGWRIAAAVALYLGLLFLHSSIAGVPVWPG
jgi:uncharacterized membrane protein